MPARKPLIGMSFVITGTLSQVRSEISKDIEQKGGSIKTTVTDNTDFLVAGDREFVNNENLERVVNREQFPHP